MKCEDADGTCKGEVVYAPDPYEEDVNGVIIMVWLCEQHTHDRIMEI